MDTRAFTGYKLSEQIRMRFADDVEAGAFRVALISFGFKHGIPSDADVVWDVRFLPNPFYFEEIIQCHAGTDGSGCAGSSFLRVLPELC